MRTDPEQRMAVIKRMALDDDDGRWDGPELQMYALAGQDRDTGKLTPHAVKELLAIAAEPDNKFVGGSKQIVYDLLLNKAQVEPLTLPGVRPEPVSFVSRKDGANKIYTIWIDGTTVRADFGPVGGWVQHKAWPKDTLAQAEALYRAKIKEKTGAAKGYQRKASAEDANKAAAAQNKDVYSVTEMDWHEMEDKIKAVYGREYEIVAGEEWGNDSQHLFQVTGKAEDIWEDDVKDFIKGERDQYVLGTLMDDMCRRGELAAGKYLITVCW